MLLAFHELKNEDDLMSTRATVKMHASDLGFSSVNQTKIVTAASELGRNTIEHGLGGSVKIESLTDLERKGLRMIFEDRGPGIPDLGLAMSDGYTTKNGLGLGLSGSKRLMDELNVTARDGGGTTVVVTKWM